MTQVNFYDKDQTDELLNAKASASDVTALETSVGKDTDTASASGSLWARIKYVLAHWLTTDSEQTVSAKKTFSVSPRVPTEPADDDSAINSFYANDSTGTIENNILHKDGNENRKGTLKIDGLIETPMNKPSLAKSTGGNYMLIATLPMSNYYTISLDMVGLGRHGNITNGGANGSYVTTFSIDGPVGDAPTTMEVFTVDNSETGLREIWIKVAPSSRFYVTPKIYEINAEAQSVETLAFPGTLSTADPITLANRTNKNVGTSLYNGTVM